MKRIAIYLMAAAVLFTAACEDKDKENGKKDRPLTVNGVSLDNTMLNLTVNSMVPLTATVKPENASNKSVTWESSDNAVATVSSEGNVTAVSEGNATITVTTVEGEKTAKCVVTVYIPPTPVTGIEMSEAPLRLEKGATHELTATVLPADATEQRIRWSTSDKEVATVADGLVTAVGTGTAKITAITREGEFAKECEVEVIISVTGVTLNRENHEMLLGGEPFTLEATIEPLDYTLDVTIEWESDDATVVEVDPETGELTAIAVGDTKVRVIVTTEDGDVFTAECEVSVTESTEVYLEIGDDLKAVMEELSSVGKTIILPAGYEFTITAPIGIPGSMTISGATEGQRPKISVAREGDAFSFPSEAGATITFENVEIVNTRDVQPANAGHVFNPNGNFEIAEIAFINCRIANFSRNMIRMRTGVVIDNFVIDNCILEDMGNNEGNYGFFHVESGASNVKNISITNSTFIRQGGHLIFYHDVITESNESIKIENCTFFDALTRNNTSAQWFIKVNASNSNITLSNLILGSTRDAVVHNEYLAGAGATFSATNVWTTNDWTTTNNFPASAGIQNYNGTAADLFADPANGDLTIKDLTFAGAATAGDPRWR